MGHGNSDRLFVTHSEHSGVYGDGLHSASTGARSKRPTAAFSRLPFDCCALTLKPFETPVATLDGTIYDLLSIIPFIRLHGTDPVTGKKLNSASLVKLTFFYNNDGKAHDPVTYKVFNEHTHLVAVKTASAANVYSRESIDRLNIKPGSMNDLMNDEPFTRADIITLQDPQNIEMRDLSQFDYVKRELKVSEVTEGGNLAGINLAASGVSKLLKSLPGNADGPKRVAPPAASTSKAAVPYNSSTISSGRAASSFTSTALTPVTKTENALWDEEGMMFESIVSKQEKAFVRLVTNFGNLNLELFCDRAPRTCYNFIQLALADKYKSTLFHRLIPGFMLQGGDPTGTGKGGESCWGGNFADEFRLRNAHKHTERGILSMANHGPNTNGSQFFITFRATDHLNGKHTVFGRVVGGEDVLGMIERVPVGATDRPLKQVTLKEVVVFVNPYANYQEKLKKRLEREKDDADLLGAKALRRAAGEKDRTTWLGGKLGEKDTSVIKDLGGKVGVGKYLGTGKEEGKIELGVKRKEGVLDLDRKLEIGGSATGKKKRKQGGDFEGW